MENREKVVDRIRKLLSVTEEHGATEAEAIAAALAAQRLIADYDIGEWEFSDEMEPIDSVFSPKKRSWHLSLAVVVAENFRCRAYHQREPVPGRRRRKSYVAFLGYRRDAQAASLVYEKLASVGHRKAREWSKARVAQLESEGYLAENLLVYNTYATGFVEGVRSALEKQSHELMLVRPKEVDEEYDSLFSEDDKPISVSFEHYRDDHESRERGLQDGADAVASSRLGAADPTFLLC